MLATVSCGGGAGTVTGTTIPTASLLATPVDRCAAYSTTPASAGAVVNVPPGDVAAFPNAASCTDVASLHNGAILVIEGAAQSGIDSMVGLDASDNDSFADNPGAGTSVTTANQSINGEALALDADGSLTALVVAGDPTQTQSEIAAWIGEQSTASSRRQTRSTSSPAGAWTTLLTEKSVAWDPQLSGRVYFSRTMSVYRLNSADPTSDYYLVNNIVTTTPNDTSCGDFCGTFLVQRSTQVALGNLPDQTSSALGPGGLPFFPAAVLDYGPSAINGVPAGYTVGSNLEGGDSVSGAFSISWSQPPDVVTTIFENPPSLPDGYILWQETFPTATPPSVSSTSAFTSYNSAVYRVRGGTTVVGVDVKSTSGYGFTTGAPVRTATIESKLNLHVPQFSGAYYKSYNQQAVQLRANNGNGGVLRWQLVNTQTATVAPSRGAGDAIINVVGPAAFFEFDTIPPYAAPSTKAFPLFVYPGN